MRRDLARVPELLRQRWLRLGAPLFVKKETGSTNDDAKEGARDFAPHGAVWVAETQSRGRGRQGRQWHSPPGDSLLFSVLMRLSCVPARVPMLSLASGLAVRDAVAKAFGDDGARVLVKWPNDVVVLQPDGSYRKVAGILVESALSGSRVEYVVIGIGINVHTQRFPSELELIATSIAREVTLPPDRADILVDVLESLERDVETTAHRGLAPLRARLADHDALFGREVASDDGRIQGKAEGIDDDGRLRIRTKEGTLLTVASGEVRPVPPAVEPSPG